LTLRTQYLDFRRCRIGIPTYLEDLLRALRFAAPRARRPHKRERTRGSTAVDWRRSNGCGRQALATATSRYLAGVHSARGRKCFGNRRLAAVSSLCSLRRRCFRKHGVPQRGRLSTVLLFHHVAVTLRGFVRVSPSAARAAAVRRGLVVWQNHRLIAR
jgi:hypothetical protein